MNGDRSAALLRAALSAFALVPAPLVWLLSPESSAYVWCLLATPLLVLVANRSRLQPAYSSGVWLSAVYLVVVPALGYAFADQLALAAGVSLNFSLPEQTRMDSVRLFAVSATCLTVGAVITAARPTAALRRLQTGLHFRDRHLGLILAVCVLPIVLIVGAAGGDVLSRPTYLNDGLVGSVPFILGIAGGTGAVAACGYAAAVPGNQFRRFLAVALGITYFVLFFALASRRMALVPVLFATGVVLAATRHRAAIASAGAALSAALLPIPLFLRSNVTHGLWPYSQAIKEFSYADVNWVDMSNNVLIAFPLSGATAYERPPLSLETFYVSINPMPGVLTNYYDLLPQLRFDAVTPFSTVGQVGNYGWGYVVGVWLAFGLVLGWIERRIGAYRMSGNPVLAVGFLGAALLFTIQATQYPLRQSVRLLLYVIVLELILRAVAWRREARARAVVEPDEAPAPVSAAP